MKLAVLLFAVSLPLAALAVVTAPEEKKPDPKAAQSAPKKKATAKAPAKPVAKTAPAPAKASTTQAVKGSYSTTREPIRDTQGNVIPTDPNAYDVSSAIGPAKK